jgi:hypothetical protein
VQHCRNVERATVALRWPEANALCGVHGRIVESVSQTADNTPHADLAVCSEIHFQQNIAFNMATTSFVGINRIRFADDLNGSSSVVA